MKLRKDPFFIGAVTLLCFPLGIALTLRSDMNKKMRLLFLSLGGIINILILLFALHQPAPKTMPDTYLITVTDDTLLVGQSASVSLTSGNISDCNFELIPENDCLSVSGSVFTAEKVGNCLLQVKNNGKEAFIPIAVTADYGGKEAVFLTQSGEKYHKIKSHCRKNILTMTREEAIRSGKTPCKICY